jgi:hypothetical protein
MGCVGPAVRCTLGHPAVTKPFAGSRSVGLGWGGIRTSTGSTSGQSLADTPTQYSGCVRAAWLGHVRGEIRSGVVEVSGGHVGGEQGCVLEEWSGGGERASALASPARCSARPLSLNISCTKCRHAILTAWEGCWANVGGIAAGFAPSTVAATVGDW